MYSRRTEYVNNLSRQIWKISNSGNEISKFQVSLPDIIAIAMENPLSIMCGYPAVSHDIGSELFGLVITDIDESITSVIYCNGDEVIVTRQEQE